MLNTLSNIPQDPVTSSDNTNFYMSAGLSSLTGVLNSYYSSKAFEKKVELDTQTRVSNMDTLMTSFKYNEVKLSEQYRALDSAYADKVTERTLQGMKEVSRAKAMQAETGAGGIAASETIGQNITDQVFDIAVINNERKKSLGSITAQQEELERKTEQELIRLATPALQSYNNEWLSGLTGATYTLGGLLKTMPDSLLAEVLGEPTTSGINGYDTASSVMN